MTAVLVSILHVANFVFALHEFGFEIRADQYNRQKLKVQNHKLLRLFSLVVFLCVTYFLGGFLGV